MHKKRALNLAWPVIAAVIAVVVLVTRPEIASAKSIARLGILFLVLGLAATFLMYKLWGYDFDKESHTSAAPAWAMVMHRLLGYGFVVTYIAIMAYMLPRMWEYQVKLETTTVIHILLGFTVGFLLLIKIAIMQFFRHFEEWMPYLGTAIMLFSVLLLGMSVPFVFAEHALAGEAFTKENRARTERLLPTAGMPDGTDYAWLAKTETLAKGRTVLLTNCVRCHDLRTILIKPKTPESWYRTVVRMADKPALFKQITPQQQLTVTAYLVAITPELQASSKEIRAQTLKQKKAMQEVNSELGGINMDKAKSVYEAACSQCHELSEVDAAPPKSQAEAKELIQRMIDENDAEFEPANIPLIEAYMIKKFVGETPAAKVNSSVSSTASEGAGE